MSESLLDRILQETRRRVGERKERRPLSQVERLAALAPPPRDFASALRQPGISLIAEIKRASPSKGWLSPNIYAPSLARAYASAGARAISVLTEPYFFRGSLADLAAVRRAVELPLLCKDFILDPYQVYEAREHGADAVLLIAGVLGEALPSLMATAMSLGMPPLVEVHSEREMELALSAGARVVGINHRNLADFTVDTGLTARLRPLIPPEITVVSESGVKSREDVARMESLGVDAVLIGEALVTRPNPLVAVRELLGHPGAGT